MGREADKHVRVTKSTWRELNVRKEPGDSFDDVIQRLVESAETDEGNSDPRAKTHN